MSSPEVQLLVTEYEELLEEIREAGRASWIPWTAYLAATAALLGVGSLAGLPRIVASLSMSFLGLLVATYVFKLRRTTNLNYSRVWEIEYRWKDVAGNSGVGARWNPWDWTRLDSLWGYKVRFLGVIDFGLLFFTSFVAAAWFMIAVMTAFEAALSAEGWTWTVLTVSAAAGASTVGLWWGVTSRERQVHDRWRARHGRPSWAESGDGAQPADPRSALLLMAATVVALVLVFVAAVLLLPEASAIIGIVAGVIGVILAVAVPLGIERWKRPSLVIRKGEKVLNVQRGFCFVHGVVVNLPRTGRLGGFIERSIAPSCFVQIRFLDPATRKELLGMAGKWSRAPEPVLPAVAGNNLVHLFDPSKVPIAERLDIPPGDVGDPFAIALKRDGVAEAFGFGGWSYAHSDWLKPEYRITVSEVLVDISVTSGTVRTHAVFRLRTTGLGAGDIEIEQMV